MSSVVFHGVLSSLRPIFFIIYTADLESVVSEQGLRFINTLTMSAVQHSSSSCKGASAVLQITGSNTVIFAVL